MADPKAEEKEKEEAPAGPKMIMGFPLLQFIFFAVNVLITLGAFGFIYHTSLVYKKPAITEEQVTAEVTKVEKKKAAQAGDEIITVSYPEMTITLRGEQGGKSRYATMESALVCGSESCKAQVEENKAKVLDIIQTVVSARSYTELTSLESKFRLKHEILNQINSFLKDTAAVDFLFTNFLIQ